MERKALSKEQQELLQKPLPKEAVKPHPTKSYLSTIKTIYSAERMNEVFGVGLWRYRAEVMERAGKMVVVRVILIVPEYGIKHEAFGGNDNDDLGDAYKGAVTDALSKIFSHLGIGMDVYKGLRDNGGNGDRPNGQKINGTANAGNEIPQEQKPWLNKGSKEWDAAVVKLKAGTTTITKIKTVLRISKKDEAELLEAVNQ